MGLAGRGHRPGLLATPLLAALIVVEVTDLIFAVDSIPAILAVTTDTFVVYTGNPDPVQGRCDSDGRGMEMRPRRVLHRLAIATPMRLHAPRVS